MDLNAGGPTGVDGELAALLRDPPLLARVPQQSIARLVSAAVRHGVAGLLLYRATLGGVRVEGPWGLLREAAAGQTAIAALQDTEAQTVLVRARGVTLPCVVLKGLALAYGVYAHSWVRERSDTDVLIHEQDVPRFDALFRDLGYALVPHVRGALTLPQRHYHRDDPHGVRHAWDLHWRLTASQALRLAVPEEELWARAEPLPALDGAYVPSRPDSLLLACVHRLAHHYDDPRLIWLWDIRQLLEAMTDAEVDTFSRLASRPASAAACARSLTIARDYTGARIPDVLLPLLGRAADRRVEFLWSGSRRPITYLLGELRAAPAGVRSRLLRERVLPSPSSMRERYPSLPAALLPMAYAWRLARGIPKWIRRTRT